MPSPDPLEAWRRTDFPTADGFDVAVRGAGDGTARAVANGRVAFASDCGTAWGHVVMVDHVFYENHERRQIRSVYRYLGTTRVRPNDVVRRGQEIGAVKVPPGRAPARFVLELRWDAAWPAACTPSDPAHGHAPLGQRLAEPSAFIAARRRLAVPQEEPALLVVSTTQRKLRFWLQGEHVGDFEVAFGQGEGRKRRQHDLRTPLGMYFVVEKSRGPFPGPYGAFYGGHWIKVNYPNTYDAAWGREHGLLAANAARRIGDAWWNRKATWQGSPLGGGIGFHGWSGDWDLTGPRRLSWGCVVLRNADIETLFPRIPVGAMVVIL